MKEKKTMPEEPIVIPEMIDNSTDGCYVKIEMINEYYRLRGWPKDYFDYIFDIGAHVGYFSSIMRILHPNTTIIAVEPGPKAFADLQENAKRYNIITINKAIGTGNPTYYNQNKIIGTSHCDIKGDFEIPTITFNNLFYESGCSLDHKYFFKFDCEGGEKYIFKNENRGILQNSTQISMELHFDAPGPTALNKNWIKFPEYDNWVRKNLSDTHIVDYFKSRKRSGNGHYCMVNRKHSSEKKPIYPFNDRFKESK